MTLCASSTGALAAAGLGAAAGCGAPVAANDGAAEAACDVVAGLCANAGALAIASAIAPPASRRMMTDRVEVCVAGGRRPWRRERVELAHQRVDILDAGGLANQIAHHHRPLVEPLTNHRANPALGEIVHDLAPRDRFSVEREQSARLNFRQR